jgi:hypothetical protein
MVPDGTPPEELWLPAHCLEELITVVPLIAILPRTSSFGTGWLVAIPTKPPLENIIVHEIVNLVSRIIRAGEERVPEL